MAQSGTGGKRLEWRQWFWLGWLRFRWRLGRGVRCVSTLEVLDARPAAKFRFPQYQERWSTVADPRQGADDAGPAGTARSLVNLTVASRSVRLDVRHRVVNDTPDTQRAVQPVLRIWALTGGKGIQKAGFPLPVGARRWGSALASRTDERAPGLAGALLLLLDLAQDQKVIAVP